MMIIIEKNPLFPVSAVCATDEHIQLLKREEKSHSIFL